MAKGTRRKGLTLDKLLLRHTVSAPEVTGERYQEKWIHIHIKEFSCFLILTQRHVWYFFKLILKRGSGERETTQLGIEPET